MELYRMPNGTIRQYDGNAPEGAVPVKKAVKVEKAVEEVIETKAVEEVIETKAVEEVIETKAVEEVIETKAVEDIKNKAVTPAKNKKGSKK